MFTSTFDLQYTKYIYLLGYKKNIRRKIDEKDASEKKKTFKTATHSFSMSTLTLSQRKIWLAGIKFNSTPNPRQCFRCLSQTNSRYLRQTPANSGVRYDWFKCSLTPPHTFRYVLVVKPGCVLTTNQPPTTLVYVYITPQTHNWRLFQFLFKSCRPKITYTN